MMATSMRFDKWLRPSTGLLLLLAPLGGWAQTTVDIAVSADVIPAACVPTLGQGGKVDYGQINSSTLQLHNVTQLATRPITLTIQCDSSALVGFSVKDTRASSVTSSANDVGVSFDATQALKVTEPQKLFGLGQTSGQQNIGAWAVRLDTTRVLARNDTGSLDVDVIRGPDKDGPWTVVENADTALRGDESMIYTLTTKGAQTPVSYTMATFPLEVSAIISPLDQLDLREKTQLNGQAIFTVKYI
ncbi:DUF1120 domain-containing protein (plasmid) [Hafnia alvei]|uniref:DUF1120 domain-containing protein n=1 Tax=Hafnia alvei TaxID=569 RepID=UPI000B6AD991|nr:DUF1120 domain-containing protein [Hafnia alvei]MBI0278589.1 DUF1120 domain-containing protein [Hafnia alvei]PNL03885.1 hypothetical protein CEQ28_000315 [Hafnia alvei]